MTSMPRFGNPGVARLRFGVISDLHWAAASANGVSWHNPFDVAGVPDRVRAALRLFREAECDAVVCLGDLTHEGDEESLRALLDLLQAEWFGPLLAVPGNHDRLDQRVVDALFPTPRPGLHRVLLAAVSRDEGRFANSAESSAAVLVVASHYPLISRRELLEQRGFAYPGDLANREALANELTGNPTLVLCGHLHARDAVASGSMLQLAFAAIVEPPFECAVLDVHTAESGVVSVTRRSAGLAPTDYGLRIPVFSPDHERWRCESGQWMRARASPHGAGSETVPDVPVHLSSR
jgi:predicted phosphodiesterase